MWPELPFNMITGFPGQVSQERPDGTHIAFYDLVLEFMQCYFCLISLTEAVSKSTQFQGEVTWTPLLKRGMSMSYYKNLWGRYALVQLTLENNLAQLSNGGISCMCLVCGNRFLGSEQSF